MKKQLFLFLILLFLLSQCAPNKKETRWEIKNESPVYGLTLRYFLPLEQIQTIAGDLTTPILNEKGMGMLNLTIMSGPQYFIDGVNEGNMQEAHLIVFSKGSATVTHSMGIEGQKLNAVFKAYKFKRILGDIQLDVKKRGDSLLVEAVLRTTDGSISMSAHTLNIPGELKSADSVKVTTSESPNHYFIGSESSRRIPVDSIYIDESGNNWISAYQLPSRPDQISLSIYSHWDFTFKEELDKSLTQNK